jgi:hypothetical protein
VENPGTKVVLNFPPGVYKVNPEDIPHVRLSREPEEDLYMVTAPGGGSIDILQGESRIVMTFDGVAMTSDPGMEVTRERRWGI